MTDEQINQRIAEACGWTEIHDSGPWHNHKPWGYPPQPTGTGGNAYKYVPDYCSDLNAMHEAEKVLKIGYCKEYKDNLYDAALELEKKNWEMDALFTTSPPTCRGVSAHAGQMGGGAGVSLKECPFCGMTFTLSVSRISRFDHSVECSHCGAIGPEEDSAEFAIKAWNEGTPRYHRVHKLEEALKRIRDCDFVITLPDRMDAVRQIAREALE